jgi:transcriptional regulator with XRE-family HTH domain
MSKFLTVDQAIGQRLREARLELALRQDQVASAARQAGLDWTQPTVAAIERGARALSLGEWFVLPVVIAYATNYETDLELADLLPASGRVALSGETTADVRALRAALMGRGTDQDRLPFSDFDTPFTRRMREGFRRMTAAIKELLPLWPDMTPRGYEAAHEAAQGDAERKAARKLGVAPLELSVAAHGRYGRSFTAERDARVDARTNAAPPAVVGRDQLVRDGTEVLPRTLQALRGHVTRAMLAELAPALTKEGRD